MTGRPPNAFPTTPSSRLDGRRALVTGAGRGLGLAAALALGEAGATETLLSRTAEDVEAAAAEFRSRGGWAETMTVDVNDTERCTAMTEAAEPFDILVNNAGTNRPAPFVEVSRRDYDDVFGLNVRAAFFVAQSVVQRMIEAGRRGSVINVSSQMGHVGAAGRAVYCATKHAVEGLTKAMAAELGQNGIRVNSLCPTFIETPMTAPFLADAALRSFVLSKINIGRLGRVEDLMGGVVFLASDSSALMTGASLVLDGGWTSTS